MKDEGAKKTLRLVLLGNSQRDAFELLGHLAQSGYDIVSYERAYTSWGLTVALDSGSWDAVIANLHTPTLRLPEALRLVHEKDPDLPFIVVTSMEDDNDIARATKTGAYDFVPKSDLARLGSTIEREIQTTEKRRSRKRADGMTHANIARLPRSLLQHAPDVVTVLDINGVIRYESPALRRMLGYEPDELVGRSVFEYTHPDDLDRSEGADVLSRSGVHSPIDLRFRHKDGSWRHLEAVVNDRRDDSSVEGLVVAFRDVTEGRRVEQALRESEELHRLMVEQATEYIVLVDANTGSLLESNAAFRKSLGYDPEELVGMRLYDYVVHDRQDIDSTIKHVLERGNYYVGERQYRRKDGILLEVDVYVSKISYKNRNALCIVAHNITERKRTEESLRRSLDVLLALREAGQILGSTLESEKIVTRLLEIMRGVSGLVAAVISVRDEHGYVRVWNDAGLDDLWSRARYVPEAEAARNTVLKTGTSQSFRLHRPDPGTGHLAGLCLPLRMRDQSILGVLEAYGPESLAEQDVFEILESLAAQAASALENAQLYGALAEREKLLEDFVRKLILAQEEERKRVSYEVHDGLTQVIVAAYQHLQAFTKRYPPTSEKGAKDLDRILRLVRRTVGEARRIIANLRPMTLDDFGLAAAVRHEIEELRGDGWQIDYEEELGEERLPVEIETALFRVAQEALTNTRKHARTNLACVRLRPRGDFIELQVRDWGHGFNRSVLEGSGGPGERVGISGMRERVGMLGGHLEVRSWPGEGTSILARVPLWTPGEVGREAAISTKVDTANLGPMSTIEPRNDVG